MNMKRFFMFLILALAVSVGSVFAQSFVVRGYDWNNCTAYAELAVFQASL
jgi:hypothetical protein